MSGPVEAWTWFALMPTPPSTPSTLAALLCRITPHAQLSHPTPLINVWINLCLYWKSVLLESSGSYSIYLDISCNKGVRRTVICQGKDWFWAKQKMCFFPELLFSQSFCLNFMKKPFLRKLMLTSKEFRYPKIWDIDGAMHIVTDPIIKPRQNWQQSAIHEKS